MRTSLVRAPKVLTACVQRRHETEAENKSRLRKQRSPIENYVLMRHMSEVEVSSLDSWIDHGKLREEKKELETILKSSGYGVHQLAPDMGSKCSSHIGKYALSEDSHLLLFYQDGHAKSAHKAINHCLSERGIIVPTVPMEGRYSELRYDPRDICVIEKARYWLLGNRDEESQQCSEVIRSFLTPEGGDGLREARRASNLDKTIKGADLTARGIPRLLSHMMMSPDGSNLIYDDSVTAIPTLIKELGIHHHNIDCFPAPPYATQAKTLFPQVVGQKPTLLVPLGFQDAYKFLNEYRSSMEVVQVPFTEHLKMGVHLSDVLLHVKASVEHDEGFETSGPRRSNMYDAESFDHTGRGKFKNRFAWTADPFTMDEALPEDSFLHKEFAKYEGKFNRVKSSSNHAIRNEAQFQETMRHQEKVISFKPKLKSFADFKKRNTVTGGRRGGGGGAL